MGSSSQCAREWRRAGRSKQGVSPLELSKMHRLGAFSWIEKNMREPWSSPSLVVNLLDEEHGETNMLELQRIFEESKLKPTAKLRVLLAFFFQLSPAPPRPCPPFWRACVRARARRRGHRPADRLRRERPRDRQGRAGFPARRQGERPAARWRCFHLCLWAILFTSFLVRFFNCALSQHQSAKWGAGVGGASVESAARGGACAA